LEAGEAVGDEAFAPLADRVAITLQFGGDLLVGGVVVAGGPEDESATPDQGLRSRTGTDQELELQSEGGGENDQRAKRTWHKGPPCRRDNRDAVEAIIMPRSCPCVQQLAANL
jgi:hypothetical protein